jgi:hypothetical protein
MFSWAVIFRILITGIDKILFSFSTSARNFHLCHIQFLLFTQKCRNLRIRKNLAFHCLYKPEKYCSSVNHDNRKEQVYFMCGHIRQCKLLFIQCFKVKRKGRGKVTLSTPWRNKGGAEVWLHSALTWPFNEGQSSTSCTSHFSPLERSADTHWIGGWICPRAGLGVLEN